MLLHDIAHARTGDKGSLVTISLIAYRMEDFVLLDRQVTAERVAAHFSELIAGSVERYRMPRLGALNFVLHRPALNTVTRSLLLDTHGKCLGSALLALAIERED
jgi:hypothetical protein